MRENKDADQLRGNREADQRLCIRYTDSTFPPLLIPKLSRFYGSSVTVQAGLCWTWWKTQIVGFFNHRLNYSFPVPSYFICSNFVFSAAWLTGIVCVYGLMDQLKIHVDVKFLYASKSASNFLSSNPAYFVYRSSLHNKWL